MFLRLFLLFTIVPVMELWLLIRVGERIGAPATVAMVIITGALGAWFARSQGAKVLRAFQEASARGKLPADEILDGALILVGGAMLITPGVVTDLVGLSLVAPFTRRPLRQWLKRTMAGRMTVVTHGPMGFGAQTYGTAPHGPKPHGHRPPHHGRPDTTPKNDNDIIDV